MSVQINLLDVIQHEKHFLSFTLALVVIESSLEQGF